MAWVRSCLVTLLAATACAESEHVRTVETAPAGDRDSCDASPRSLTFIHQIRTKMFIDEVKPIPAACNSAAVIGPPPETTAPDEAHAAWVARKAAFVVFCASTNLSFFDKPADGALREPLDARILANVGVAFTCEPGQKKPVWSNVTEIFRAAGTELVVFQGTADPVEVANDITGTGRYAFLSSGRPSNKLELAFDGQKYRKNTSIWHRWAGDVECTIDPLGNLGARSRGRFSHATGFPTHRAYLWATDKSGKDKQVSVLQTVAQGNFSNLWFLADKPPVGTP